MVDEQGRIDLLVETDAVLRPDYARVGLDKRQKTLIYDSRPPLVTGFQRASLLNRFIRLDSSSQRGTSGYEHGRGSRLRRNRRSVYAQPSRMGRWPNGEI